MIGISFQSCVTLRNVIYDRRASHMGDRNPQDDTSIKFVNNLSQYYRQFKKFAVAIGGINDSLLFNFSQWLEWI